jgi:CRP-like cAMP-binding protein
MDSDSLRSIPFLEKLTDAELQAFAGLIETRDYKRGDRILEEGSVPTAFYVIRDGVVHVRRRANKREMLLTRLGSGSFFGEINLFDPGLATASIYAMKDSRIAAIPYDRFRAYMDQHPYAGYRIASAILSELAQRMRTTSARLANSIYRAIPTPGAPATAAGNPAPGTPDTAAS